MSYSPEFIARVATLRNPIDLTDYYTTPSGKSAIVEGFLAGQADLLFYGADKHELTIRRSRFMEQAMKATAAEDLENGTANFDALRVGYLRAIRGGRDPFGRGG